MIVLISILWISNWIWHTHYETVDLILSIVKAIEVFDKYFLLPYNSNCKYKEKIQEKKWKMIKLIYKQTMINQYQYNESLLR